jgi:hypothetical protein
MNLAAICKEHQNVKHVQLYLDGRGSNYVRKTLVVDRPINQLSEKVLNDDVYNVRFSLNKAGEVVVKAVLA